MSWIRRLRNAFRSEDVSDAIDREMAYHISRRTEDLVAAGMSPGAARARARNRFGDIGKHSDETRDRDVIGWFATLVSDVRYALRMMRAHPGPTIIVGLTLAFGLGVNASVLGVIDGLLLRPYQFPDYQRLVVVWETPTAASERDPVAPAKFLEWKSQTTRLDQLAAWEGWSATLTQEGEPEHVFAFRVSPGFFELLGVPPAAGRSFAPDEGNPGNDRRVVISDAFWKRRLGSDPAIVGKELILDDVSHTIIGVAPPDFDFPMAADLWAPLAFSPARADDRTNRSLTVMGKLADGASLGDAQAEMDVITQRLAAAHPAEYAGRGASVRTLSRAFTEGAAFIVSGVLQTAAALVLLVACANLAGLLLARSIDRRRELAVRVALGASRGRILRQLVTETVVISLMASAVAMTCAHFGLGLLRSSVPLDTARYVEGWNNVRLDWALMWVIPALAIAIGALVAILPALTALRGTSPTALRESDRGATGSIPALRGRQALVVAEIAFALTILVAAGLTVKSGMRMVNTSGGFDAERLLILQARLAERKYPSPQSRRQFAIEATDRLQAIPGVESAALGNILPANGWNPSMPVLVEDELLTGNTARQDLAADPGLWPKIGYRSISDNFFETLRIQLQSGRGFTTGDIEDGLPVAVVSASFARRFWPGEDAIGKRVRVGDTSRVWRTVVGVVADVNMYNWWDGVDHRAVYVPLRQAPSAGMLHAVLRTRGDPTAAASAVRSAFQQLDPTLPLDQVRTMRQAIAENGRGLNLLAMLLGVCGGIALLLAVIGIYGLMAYTFTQRTQEFGVRIAFGATAGDVLRLTLKRAAVLTAVGLGIGLPLAWTLAMGMASALDGVVALDSMTFALVALALAIVALGAAYLPARRALRLNPATILR
jgi:putative ABC transport system permease protein